LINLTAQLTVTHSLVVSAMFRTVFRTDVTVMAVMSSMRVSKVRRGRKLRHKANRHAFRTQGGHPAIIEIAGHGATGEQALHKQSGRYHKEQRSISSCRYGGRHPFQDNRRFSGII
jgi:hypothetical protein